MKRFIIFLIVAISMASCQDLVEQTKVGNNHLETEEGVKLYAQKSVNPETRGIALNRHLWEVGQTIRIKFLNGTEEQIEKVKLYAAEWLDYANLHFSYVDYLEQADVKIAFQWNGDPVTWSVVGTEATYVNQTLPTLNFGSMSNIERFFKRDVLMQFGHVLGMVNEHKIENNPIQLDEEVVYAYYSEQGWSVREITDFFFNPYSSAVANHTEYDPNSIMVWPIPEDLTINGIAQTRNNELSQIDKDFIGTLYPFIPPTDYVTILSLQIEDSTPGITLAHILNTTAHVRIDYGDGEIYEGSGDLIPHHIFFGWYPQGYDATIAIETEELSLRFESSFYRQLYKLKLNGFTKYEEIIINSSPFVNIETDPLNPPIFLQENFYRFFVFSTFRTIPENIFQGAINAKSFNSTFFYCQSLTNIPENLFVGNPNVTDFGETFHYCRSLKEIPENLFANNPNVTDFSNTFNYCQSLTNIPGNLFANNLNVTSFNATFQFCENLTSIPENLFVNNSNVTDFSSTFEGCTSLTGYAPRLWERENVVGTGCFRGCTGLVNYDEIPDDWK